MWGSVPINFSSSDESDMACDLFFLAMNHFLEVKGGVPIWGFFGPLPNLFIFGR